MHLAHKADQAANGEDGEGGARLYGHASQQEVDHGIEG